MRHDGFALTSISFFSFWLVACGGGAPPATAPTTAPRPVAATAVAIKGDGIVGMQKYQGTCVACHGAGGLGLPKLGKDLVHSDFVRQKKDSELLQFLRTGRTAADPLNTTKVDMPPKGGNPALNDKDLADIVAYLRMLQEG